MKIKKSNIFTAIIFIFLLLPLNLFSLPESKGYVSDYAGVISDNDKAVITSLATEIKKKSGAEIAVLTVETISPYGSIEEFSIDVAEKWGIGNKEKDNGVLIVLSTGDRIVRIEVGYGLEGALPDGKTGQIIDSYILPLFRQGNFSGGLKNGAVAVASVIAEEYQITVDNNSLGIISSSSAQKRPVRRGISLIDILIFLFIFMGGGRFFLPLFLLSGFGRRGYYGGGFGSGHGGGFSGFGGGGGFEGGGFGGGGASRGF